MELHRDELRFRTTAETNILDLTPQVAEIVRRSGMAEGQVLVFTPGSTVLGVRRSPSANEAGDGRGHLRP